MAATGCTGDQITANLVLHLSVPCGSGTCGPLSRWDRDTYIGSLDIAPPSILADIAADPDQGDPNNPYNLSMALPYINFVTAPPSYAQKCVSKFTLPTEMLIDAITAPLQSYYSGGISFSHLTAVIYSDVGGVPGTLLAQSPSIEISVETVTGPKSLAWEVYVFRFQ